MDRVVVVFVVFAGAAERGNYWGVLGRPKIEYVPN